MVLIIGARRTVSGRDTRRKERRASAKLQVNVNGRTRKAAPTPSKTTTQAQLKPHVTRTKGKGVRGKPVSLEIHCGRCGCASCFNYVILLAREEDRVGRDINEAHYIREGGEESCVNSASLALFDIEILYLSGR